MSARFPAYSEWTPATPPPDPRNAAGSQLTAAIRDLVSVEGPILQSWLTATYVRAIPDLSRAGRVVREAIQSGLDAAVAGGHLVVEYELGGDGPESAVVRTPDQPAVRVRARGQRGLEDIPLGELAAAFLKVSSVTGVSRYTETLQRALLRELELIRLTALAKQRLLTAWKVAERWRDAGVKDPESAATPVEPLPDQSAEAPQATRQPAAAKSLWESYSLSPKPYTTRSND